MGAVLWARNGVTTLPPPKQHDPTQTRPNLHKIDDRDPENLPRATPGKSPKNDPEKQKQPAGEGGLRVPVFGGELHERGREVGERATDALDVRVPICLRGFERLVSELCLEIANVASKVGAVGVAQTMRGDARQERGRVARGGERALDCPVRQVPAQELLALRVAHRPGRREEERPPEGVRSARVFAREGVGHLEGERRRAGLVEIEDPAGVLDLAPERGVELARELHDTVVAVLRCSDDEARFREAHVFQAQFQGFVYAQADPVEHEGDEASRHVGRVVELTKERDHLVARWAMPLEARTLGAQGVHVAELLALGFVEGVERGEVVVLGGGGDMIDHRAPGEVGLGFPFGGPITRAGEDEVVEMAGGGGVGVESLPVAALEFERDTEPLKHLLFGLHVGFMLSARAATLAHLVMSKISQNHC